MFAVFGLGWPEILVLLAIGLLLFGRRLPELARTLGRTVMNVRKGLDGLEDDFHP
jgi:sec-independent protein translocase protein TatA